MIEIPISLVLLGGIVFVVVSAMRSALQDLVPAEAAAQQCARLRELARPA